MESEGIIKAVIHSENCVVNLQPLQDDVGMKRRILAQWSGAEFNEAAEIEPTPEHAGLVYCYNRDFPTREPIGGGHHGWVIARVAG